MCVEQAVILPDRLWPKVPFRHVALGEEPEGVGGVEASLLLGGFKSRLGGDVCRGVLHQRPLRLDPPLGVNLRPEG